MSLEVETCTVAVYVIKRMELRSQGSRPLAGEKVDFYRFQASPGRLLRRTSARSNVVAPH